MANYLLQKREIPKESFSLIKDNNGNEKVKWNFGRFNRFASWIQISPEKKEKKSNFCFPNFIFGTFFFFSPPPISHILLRGLENPDLLQVPNITENSKTQGVSSWSPVWKNFRIKEWEFISLSTESFFINIAVINIGYLGECFVYVVEKQPALEAAVKQAPGSGYYEEYDKIKPFASSVKSFASSSYRGNTVWLNSSEEFVKITHEPLEEAAGSKFVVDLNLKMGGRSKKSLSGQIEFSVGESLALLFALEVDRPAYTHKAAGISPARVDLRYSDGQGYDERINEKNSYVAIDWTRSYARRITSWKWACFSGQALSGERIGLNLSAEVYEDHFGNGLENALWIDGKMYIIGGVEFDLGYRPLTDYWLIKTKDNQPHCKRESGDERKEGQGEITDGQDEMVILDLSFQPSGSRSSSINLAFVVVSKFIQPYGFFSGTVILVSKKTGSKKVYKLENVVGVVENHFAKW